MIPEKNEIFQTDCLEFMKSIDSNYYNIIYTDTPYNMGSEYYIDKTTGHYRFKGSKSSDFMNKWIAFDGIWWDKFFEYSYKIIKEGGFFITHNIDRQSDMWTYYARRNGFLPLQKLYWLFIDNFPKGVDLGLALDKIEGVDRTVVGKSKGAQAESTGKYGAWGTKASSSIFGKGTSYYDKTEATSELAKKYDGYKYGIASLKQVMEEILIFWKPFEDDKLTIPRIVKMQEESFINNRPSKYHPSIYNISGTMVRPEGYRSKKVNRELWTPQLLIDNRLMENFIEQLGHKNGADLIDPMVKIKFSEEELIPYHFCRKANNAEREAGLEEFEAKVVIDGRKAEVDNPFQRGKKERKNVHPTPKPIELCRWVLSLFTIPNKEDMIIFDPFSGQGSIPSAALMEGIKFNGTEIDKEFHDLCLAKLKYYKNVRKDKAEEFLFNF